MVHFTVKQQAQLLREAEQHGMYRSELERDACGMGFVAHIKGLKSHAIVEHAIAVLTNLTHRGATGCDPCTGDGAGILVQLPHRFFEQVCAPSKIALPAAGRYGVGMLFLPAEPEQLARAVAFCEQEARSEGFTVLGWREVPIDKAACGDLARESLPAIRQLFLSRSADGEGEALERKLYVLRHRLDSGALEAGLGESGFYVCSLSSRTIVYKGLLIADQMKQFYRDLGDPTFETAIAMIHSRFSTNTFPSWARAHPYRFICHNGEINTLRGNLNWMRAREKQFKSNEFGDDIKKLLPVINEGGSDSEAFDNALELLLHTGRSLPHVVMMMIPEAWQEHAAMSPEKRAFYEYHSCLMEPWDGPASIAFSDGVVVGAVLDRNGLRPSRYYVTKDDLVIMASEVGVLDVPAERVLEKRRLQPGRMFLVDTKEGRIISDEEIKQEMAEARPYGKWLKA